MVMTGNLSEVPQKFCSVPWLSGDCLERPFHLSPSLSYFFCLCQTRYTYLVSTLIGHSSRSSAFCGFTVTDTTDTPYPPLHQWKWATADDGRWIIPSTDWRGSSVVGYRQQFVTVTNLITLPFSCACDKWTERSRPKRRGIKSYVTTSENDTVNLQKSSYKVSVPDKMSVSKPWPCIVLRFSCLSTPTLAR